MTSGEQHTNPDSNSWISQNWIYLIGSLSLVGTLVMTLYQQYHISWNETPQELVQNHITLDSTLVIFKDQSLKRSFSTDVDSIRTQYAKFSGDTLSAMIFDYSKKTLAEIIGAKNEKVFLYHRLSREKEFKQTSKINIWLLLFIVLLCGTIGGLARSNYKYLEDLIGKVSALEESAKKLLDQEENLKNPHDFVQSRVLFAKANKEVKEAVDKLPKKVQAIDKNDSVRANWIFGVVASSLSFIALKFADSNVLEFQTEIDYFIFAGWCLIGAVFAKNWIKGIYDRVSTSVTS